VLAAQITSEVKSGQPTVVNIAKLFTSLSLTVILRKLEYFAHVNILSGYLEVTIKHLNLP
jgi:hypothetical protein